MTRQTYWPDNKEELHVKKKVSIATAIIASVAAMAGYAFKRFGSNADNDSMTDAPTAS